MSETLPDNMGLSWFPVFSNGSQLWGFFLSGAPSECCPTGRRSSENKMTERTEEGWKKRRRGGEIIVRRESNKNRPDLLRSKTERRRRTKRWVILRTSDFWGGKKSKNKIVCFALFKQIFLFFFCSLPIAKNE